MVLAPCASYPSLALPVSHPSYAPTAGERTRRSVNSTCASPPEAVSSALPSLCDFLMITAAAPNALVRRLRAPGYLILGIAMVLPLLDLLVSVMPLKPTTVVWRFGAVGLLSSAIGAPLLILFFIFVLAFLAGDRKIVALCAALAAVIALIMIAGAGTFALDALQMKRRVQEAAQARFLLASAQAMMKLGLEGLASLVLAVSAFRTFKGAKAVAVARAEARPSSSLLMGRAATAKPVTGEIAQIPAAVAQPVDE